jgi:HSP20 family protein
MYWPEVRTMGFDPFTELRRLQREMNRLFEGFGEAEGGGPPINVWSGRDQIVVTAEVPGVDPKDLQVNVQNDVFTLEGERKPEEVGENVVVHRAERPFGRFARSIRLPYEVDGHRAVAKYRNGVLTVTLPRSESSKPRQIAVTAE